MSSPSEDQKHLFAYDDIADFDVQVIDTRYQDNVTVQDISFIGVPDKTRVSAYLVRPSSGNAPCAGVLWAHWLGEEKSNREEFLDEAITMAASGVVSLLVDTMWSAPDWYPNRILEDDYANGIAQVIELRRAMTLLSAQPNIDEARMGFVGHDYGGMYGTLMAGVDQKAKTYVLLAVTPSFYDWAFYTRKPESMETYQAQNDVLEPMQYLQQINNASFLFQFAENDFYVPEPKRQEYYNHAPKPKKMMVYAEAEHNMILSEIRDDRQAWLRTELGLS